MADPLGIDPSTFSGCVDLPYFVVLLLLIGMMYLDPPVWNHRRDDREI